MSRPHNIDRKTLGDRLGRREFWGEVFGWMVGGGLLIEYWREIRDCFVKGQLPSWPLIGGLLVTLGVFGEVWFSRLAQKTTEEIQERADSDVALANERAAEALKAAAEANLLAEQERTERVRMQETLARRTVSRSLTERERNRIRARLQEFTGQPFIISALADHHDALSEQFMFIAELRKLLSDSGWIDKKDPMLYRGITGKSVKSFSRPESETAAQSLCDELNALSINASHVTDADPTVRRISILVGTL
jgi:hypothetical protein